MIHLALRGHVIKWIFWGGTFLLLSSVEQSKSDRLLVQQKWSDPHSCNVEFITLSQSDWQAGFVLSSKESQGRSVTRFFLCISCCKRDLISSSEVSGPKLPAYPSKFFCEPSLGRRCSVSALVLFLKLISFSLLFLPDRRTLLYVPLSSQSGNCVTLQIFCHFRALRFKECKLIEKEFSFSFVPRHCGRLPYLLSQPSRLASTFSFLSVNTCPLSKRGKTR